MKGKWIAMSAAVLLAAMSVEDAAAQRGGRDGSPSAGPRSPGPSGPSVAPRFEGQRPSGLRPDGQRPPGRSFSGDRPRTYSYTPRYDRRDDGRRHVRRFRRDRFFLYGAPVYESYSYGPCAYYYRRAVATGSRYWWNRYYRCRDGDYD
jgi:hypothetical protein